MIGKDQRGQVQEVDLGRVTLEISESQVVEWVQQISPEAKHGLLRALIPRLDTFEALVDHGRQRISPLSDVRGLDWDNMIEDERERQIDELLHEGGIPILSAAEFLAGVA